AACDSRTMSWAPFLISLSSSGKRNDSVSREASVHSMMSMNCFFRKSMIAIATPMYLGSFAGKRTDRTGSSSFLRGVGLGNHCRRLAQHRFELDCRQRAGNHGAVGENQRRRRADLELGPEHVGRNDGIVAVALVVRQRARRE